PAAGLGALAAWTLLGRGPDREGGEDARHVLAPAGRALDLLGLRADELLERLLAVGAAILVDRHGAQSSRACDASTTPLSYTRFQLASPLVQPVGGGELGSHPSSSAAMVPRAGGCIPRHDRDRPGREGAPGGDLP